LTWDAARGVGVSNGTTIYRMLTSLHSSPAASRSYHLLLRIGSLPQPPRTHTLTHSHTHARTHARTLSGVCVCVCMCAHSLCMHWQQMAHLYHYKLYSWPAQDQSLLSELTVSCDCWKVGHSLSHKIGTGQYNQIYHSYQKTTDPNIAYCRSHRYNWRHWPPNLVHERQTNAKCRLYIQYIYILYTHHTFYKIQLCDTMYNYITLYNIILYYIYISKCLMCFKYIPRQRYPYILSH